MRDRGQPRPKSFYLLFGVFAAYLAFLYGPMFCVFLLSFQGRDGGMSFPMTGVSLHWFEVLFAGSGGEGVGDLHNAFVRSMRLAGLVAVLTVTIAVMAGLAFRRRFRAPISSSIQPSPPWCCRHLRRLRHRTSLQLLGYQVQWFTSGIGAQLTWSLPFGLLIMFIVLGRFNPSYEEAATDLGATSWQRFREVILPIILPGVIGILMSAFTSSYEESARTSLTVGSGNTMPMEITGLLTAATSPVLFAVGTVTTVFSFTLVILTLLITLGLAKRREQRVGQH